MRIGSFALFFRYKLTFANYIDVFNSAFLSKQEFNVDNVCKC